MKSFKLKTFVSILAFASLSSISFATQVVDTEIVIVGGGLSGVAAAAKAVELGKKPVLLEKTAILGGAGNFPEGSLGLGTKYQKEHGITWDIQKNIDRFLDFNHYRTNPAVIRQLIGKSGERLIKELRFVAFAPCGLKENLITAGIYSKAVLQRLFLN